MTINESRLLETFLTLVNFNTPSRHEKPVSEWAAQYLETLGFSVEFDDAHERLPGEPGSIGNLIAFKKGTVESAPGIFFSSHFDTVEPTPGLEVKIEGDRISSASDTILGADDKCGMAPILEAMAQLSESGEAHGDIQLLLMICEEIGLVGARLLDPKRIKAKYGFVLDAGPPVGTMTYAAPAQNSFRVTITGKQSHAGAAPELGISAIVAASNAISKMQLGRIDAETTANIGTIHGGLARNIVPGEVVIIAEARSRVQEKLVAQTAHMKEVFEREAAALGASAHVEVIGEYPAYRLDKESPVLQLGARAAEAAGLTPGYAESGGGSDGNHFNAYGVPTTVLATGMQDVHTHDESCTLSEMVLDTRWIIEIVRAAAQSAH